MMVDLHMHSEYSEDAKPNASVDAICRAAIDKGLDTIALTDHKDFFFTKSPMALDIQALSRDIAMCQQKYAGQLHLLRGIELGEIHASAQAMEFVQAYDFDEVIGSLHVYRPTDTDFYFLPFAQMDLDAVLRAYFTDMLDMVRHGGFDILAHIDYPMRVMKLPEYTPTYVGLEAYIEPILREIIVREIALEINAASLFSWRKQAGPEPFVLEMYYQLGGRMITIGSDSHCAPDVGRGLQACIDAAKGAGFTQLTVFRKRCAETISI